MRETIPGLFPACEAGKHDVVAKIRAPIARHHLAARGESLAAFDERCIPTPPQRGCRVGGPGASGVAPPSNTPGIAPHRAHHARRGPRFSVGRALPAGRLARLGATPDFHHGLLDGFTRSVVVLAV